MYGTLPLCDDCAAQFRHDILKRRPDLRAPKGRRLGACDGEPATWRCDDCQATWYANDEQACPWCLERPELDRQIQQAIDECRLRDYLAAIAEGSDDAIVAATKLLKVAIPRGTLPAHTIKLMQRAITEAA